MISPSQRTHLLGKNISEKNPLAAGNTKKNIQYIEYYGMESQQLDCSKRPIAGSRRLITNCTKVPGVLTKLYEIEK